MASFGMHVHRDTPAMRAARELIKMKDQAVPALTGALKADDPLHRLNAVCVLNRIRTAATVAPRIQALSDSSARVRALAVRWLPVWSDDKARSAALGALKDADPDVRRDAARAFNPGRVHDFKAANWEINRAAEAILPLLEDRDTRAAAAGALGDLGSNCASQPLAKVLADDRYLVRVACVKAIGKLRDKYVTADVLPTLQDPEASVRHTAATALGHLADLRATPALVGALNDPKHFVRYAAAGALGQIGDRRAVEPLIKALDDPEEQVRSAAALSLGQIGDLPAIRPRRPTQPRHWRASGTRMLWRRWCKPPPRAILSRPGGLSGNWWVSHSVAGPRTWSGGGGRIGTCICRMFRRRAKRPRKNINGELWGRMFVRERSRSVARPLPPSARALQSRALAPSAH
ncbi:MAG: HEAT repeat domain-containing protein [Planctomycetota bacterium]